MDTNVLIRIMVRDDPAQAIASEQALRRASRIVITLATWCEYVWVLRRLYAVGDEQIAASIELLRDGENVITDQSAVAAGLLSLRAGGDFADGAVAREGRRLGGEVFVSFDRKAIRLVRAQGHQAELL